MLYRAEAGQYPWRRALYVTVLVFGLTLVAVQWHDSPLAENYIAIRKAFNSLEFAGLTFAVAMLCRHRKVPRALAWLGLVSYSVYLLHPALIDAYTSMPWTRNQNFMPLSPLRCRALSNAIRCHSQRFLFCVGPSYPSDSVYHSAVRSHKRAVRH